MQLTPGQLLIAPPLMPDLRFQTSVMVLCHHSHTGSFALGVNQPTGMTVNDIVDELELDFQCSLNFPVYYGGPVYQGSVWMIHSAEWWVDQTLSVNESWSITSHNSMFHCLADGDTPREFRFCHGFASWAPGQLDREMRSEPPLNSGSSWIVGEDPGPEWLFNQPEDQLWETATLKAQHQAVDAWL